MPPWWPGSRISPLQSSSPPRHFESSSRLEWLEEALDLAVANQQHISKELVGCLVEDCIKKINLQLGRRLHSLLLYNTNDAFAASAFRVIRLFASSGNLFEAHQAFSNVRKPSQYTWNSLVGAHAKLGERLALQLYEKMQDEGTKPDTFTFSTIMKACVTVEWGRQIHEQILERGLQSDMILGSSLVNMYANCGSLDEACEVFDKLQNRDVITWSSMIAGYQKQGKDYLALQCFGCMEHEGLHPNEITFLSACKACSNISAIEQARYIHEQVIESRMHSHVVVGCALLDMYAKSGSIDEAQKIFNKLPNRDVVIWGAMIAGYAQHGESLLALQCFENMHHDSMKVNKFIFSSVLKACGSIRAIEMGRFIHMKILEAGFICDTVVMNTMIDMYAKCRSLNEAHGILNRLLDRDEASWGAMIAGYTDHGEGLTALQCFGSMDHDGIKPTKVTVSNVLKACGNVGALVQGRYIDAKILDSDLQSDILESNLVNMYVKCGSLHEANSVFHGMTVRDVVSWGTIITGHAQLGKTECFQCFGDMQRYGIKANAVVMTGILTACSCTGLIDEGIWYFKTMGQLYDTRPNLCHLTCMVDLLGHAGFFNEALCLIKGSTQTDICLWMTLLTACRMHCNFELGRQCFNVVVDLDPFRTAAYLLMANMYATVRIMNVVFRVGASGHTTCEDMEEIWDNMD